MLRDADPSFSGIRCREIHVLFGAVRRKNKFVFVGCAAVNHNDGHPFEGVFDRREEPAVDIPAEQCPGSGRILIPLEARLDFLDGKHPARKRIGKMHVVVP